MINNCFISQAYKLDNLHFFTSFLVINLSQNFRNYTMNTYLKSKQIHTQGGLISPRILAMQSVAHGAGRLELVVWGTLMGSGIGMGKGRLTVKLAQIYVFPPYHYSVIIGLLLSDGWLVFTSKKWSVNPLIGFRQSLEKSHYFFSVFDILAPFCASFPSFVTGKRKSTNTYA